MYEWYYTSGTWLVVNDIHSEGAPPNMQVPEIAKPLNIRRESLIERLQENLDKEVASREEAAATAAARRQEAVDAIRSLTSDELYNILARHTGLANQGLAEWVEEAKKEETYKTKDLPQSRRENALEKFVRVLSMSADDVVEVQPNQPIYELL